MMKRLCVLFGLAITLNSSLAPSQCCYAGFVAEYSGYFELTTTEFGGPQLGPATYGTTTLDVSFDDVANYASLDFDGYGFDTNQLSIVPGNAVAGGGFIDGGDVSFIYFNYLSMSSYDPDENDSFSFNLLDGNVGANLLIFEVGPGGSGLGGIGTLPLVLNLTFSTTPLLSVPEPASVVLALSGVLAIAAFEKFRPRHSSPRV